MTTWDDDETTIAGDDDLVPGLDLDEDEDLDDEEPWGDPDSDEA